MRKPRILPCGLSVLLCASLPSVPDDLVGVPAGSFQLLPGKDGAVARVPVQIKEQGLDPSQISFTVVDVRHTGAERAVLLGAFVPDFPAAGMGTATTPILQVSVPMASLVAPRYGSYLVTFEVTTGDATQSLTLTFVFPETKLFTPQPVFVHQTRFLGWTCRASAPDLFLEVQEGPPLREVVAYQVGNATIGNEPQPGRLKLDAAKATGPIASVPISIEEPFSLGDSTGSVRIGAPGMASTQIAFTVRSRQSWALLFLVAAAGLWVGFRTRTRFQESLDRGRTRLHLQRFLAQVAGARDRQDPDFAKDLDKIEHLANDKLAAIAKMTAAERSKLPEAVTQMQQSLDKAIKDSDARFTKAEDVLTALSDVVKSVWVLPRPLAGVLAELATDVEELDGILQGQDLPGFQRELDADLGDYGAKLSTTLREWRRGVRTVLRALPKRIVPRLAADALEVHSVCLEELDTKLAEADSLPADRTQAIKHLLTTGHDARNLAEKLLDRVQDSTFVTASGVLGTLGSKARAPLPARLEQDMTRLHDLELPPLLDEPNVDAFADAASKVTAAMIDVIGSRYPAEPPADVRDLLAEAKYEEAAAQAAAPPRQARRRALASTEELETLELLGAGEPEAGMTAIRYRSRAWYPRLSEQHRTLLPARRASARVVPLELEIERTAAQIRKDERMQFLLSALGLALLSLLVFGGSFVGTFENCAQVFLWGFTTDIGVNTLLNQAKAVRK